MSNDLKKSIRKGGFWLVFSNVLGILSQLFFIYVLSKLLAPRDFGFQGTCMLILELSVVFTYPSINKAIILKKDISQQFINNATTLSLILCCSLGLLFFISSQIAILFFHKTELGFILNCLFVIMIIRGLYQPYQALFEKDLRFKETSNYTLIAYWIGYFLVPIILAFLHFGYKSLISGIIAYELILFFFYLRKANVKISKLDMPIVKEIIADARNIMFHSFGNQLATNGDYLVVSIFLGPTALGYYAQGYKIMKMPTTIIGNLLNNMSFASFSKISDDNPKLTKAFYYTSFILALFSFPIFAITFLYSHEIVLLLLGKKWMPTASVLQILSFGIFLRMSYKVPGSILRAKAKFALTAKLQLFYALNVILFSLALIKFSIDGVAFATLIALSLQYIILTHFVNKLLEVEALMFYKILLRPLFFSAFIVLLCIISKKVLIACFAFSNTIIFIISVSISLFIASFVAIKAGKKIFGDPFIWWLNFLFSKNKTNSSLITT